MKRRFGVVAAVLAIAAAAVPGMANAKTRYLTAFNNRYGTAGTRLNRCAVCHTATMPGLNPYGRAVRNKLSAGRTIGQALYAVQPYDSDLDTFTNIREIRARTFPGRKASHP